MHPEVQTLVDIFTKSGYRGEFIPTLKLARAHDSMTGLRKPQRFRCATDRDTDRRYKESLAGLLAAHDRTNLLLLTGHMKLQADLETYYSRIPWHQPALLPQEKRMYNHPLRMHEDPDYPSNLTDIHPLYILSLVGYPALHTTSLQGEYTMHLKQRKVLEHPMQTAFFGLDFIVSEHTYQTVMHLLKEKPWILNDVLLHLWFPHEKDAYCGSTEDPKTLTGTCPGINLYDAFILPPYICNYSLQGTLNVARSGELITDPEMCAPFPHFSVQIKDTLAGECLQYLCEWEWDILAKEHRREGEFW